MLGQLSLKEAVGKGSVQIVKNHPEWPRPYNGITAIRYGDIDRDIGELLINRETRYWFFEIRNLNPSLQKTTWRRVSNVLVLWLQLQR